MVTSCNTTKDLTLKNSPKNQTVIANDNKTRNAEWKILVSRYSN